MFRVKSKVYSMDFWLADTVSYDNIKIQRIGTRDEYKEIRKKISEERKHYQTGELTIEIPKEIEKISKIKEYSLNLIEKLHILLSFAHGHDVPIHELLFYEVSDDHEKLVGHEIGSIWTGKPGAISFNIHHSLEKFLATAMPLLSDEDFISKTKILQATVYYNLSASMDFQEVKFILLWLGLESMANAYYGNNPTDLVLTKEEWNSLKPRLQSHLREIGKENVYSDLLAEISFLRRGTMKERIDYMLRDDKYQMIQYSAEVASIYDKIRVPLFHGRRIDWAADPNLHEEVFRLKRLMEKVIFKTLDFYDNNVIYHAIKEEDLSAR